MRLTLRSLFVVVLVLGGCLDIPPYSATELGDTGTDDTAGLPDSAGPPADGSDALSDVAEPTPDVLADLGDAEGALPDGDGDVPPSEIDAADDVAEPALGPLSDEFSGGSLSGWSMVSPPGGAAVVDGAGDGRLVLTPESAGWFEQDRGMYLYHLVEGDFVVEAALTVGTAVSPDAVPAGTYQVAGLMARDPASAGATEAWVLVELGIASVAGTAQTTRKTTHSGLTEQWPVQPPLRTGVLRLCRHGSDFRVFARAALADPLGSGEAVAWTAGTPPSTLQVGIMAGRYLNTGDMVGYVDWVRFARPTANEGCAAAVAPP